MLDMSPTLTDADNLQIYTAPIPQTTDGVPHLQIGVDAVPESTEALLDHVAQFPGVILGLTRVSMTGGIGFQIDADVILACPDVIVGSREFAHLHTYGSLPFASPDRVFPLLGECAACFDSIAAPR